MFPNYKTTKHTFLFLKWNKKTEDEWKDLGLTETHHKVINNEIVEVHEICPLCKNWLNVGKENGKTFLFCDRCLEKISKITI